MTVIESLFLIGMMVSFTASLVLAVVVNTSHAKRSIRHSFVWTLVASALWIGSNLIYQVTGAGGDVSYIAALLAYTFACWTVLAFTYFVAKFTDWKSVKVIIDIAFVTLSIGAVAFAIPGFLATGLSDGGIVTTRWIDFYGLVIVIILGIAVVRLIVSWRSSSGRLRKQIGGMIWLLLIVAALALVFNLALPIAGIYSFVSLGPACFALFVGMTSYLILARGLFGARMIAAKAITYLLMVLALSAIGLLLALILWAFDIIQQVPISAYVIVTFLLFIVTAVFQPLQHRLRHLTDNLFYKNSYDTDKFERNLNRIMLSNVTVSDLLNDSSRMINATLKSSSVSFSLNPDDDFERSTYGANKQLSDNELRIIDDHFASIKEDFVVMDETSSINPIRQIGYDKNVDVIMKLSSRSGRPSLCTIGYMLIGSRQDGASYNNRDISVLIVTSHMISLALENARYYERVSLFNQHLKQEVDEATSSLRSANRKLKKLYKAEDDFIAMASHQLRTPLTSIRGYISMLIEGDFGKITGEQRHVLDDVYTSSERMVFLISDFLDVSRLQTGKFELLRTPMRLDEILAPEIQQMEIPAELRQIDLNYTPPANLPLIDGDRDKLRQVMINMIDNAIFYSHAGGSATISLYEHAGQVIFTVRDTGIGVPRSEQSKLFTKFFRASNARNVRPDGTGVGLFMVRKVIVAHGGSLIFESKEGVGSTFGFRLPVMTDEPK
ncbi:ATP-binding protein [Candidatus Saccharibacteria bacterium]|nr:ATP-binding protein [Candidatus Saccharibacteria bacterium]